MAQLALDDHPDRYALANELHARPFPELTAPCRAVHLAIKQPANAADRDRALRLRAPDRAARPLRRAAPGAGRQPLFRAARPRLPEMGDAHRVRHLHASSPTGSPTSRSPARSSRSSPRDWLADGAGQGGHLLPGPGRERARRERSSGGSSDEFPQWFVPESLAVSRVVDGEAVIAGDFRIDENGHSRFAVLVRPGDRPAPARAHRAAAARDRDLQVRWRC